MRIYDAGSPPIKIQPIVLSLKVFCACLIYSLPNESDGSPCGSLLIKLRV